MLKRVLAALPLLILSGVAAADAPAMPAPPTIEAFSQLPDMEGVSITPDGRYLAYLSAVQGRPVVLTYDRVSKKIQPVLTNDEDGEFSISWCRWANDTRLLCGLRAIARDFGVQYPVTRLVAVNADGKQQQVLMRRLSVRSAQYQDSILDWTPDEPDSVLIEADDDQDGYPSVFELNVNTGALKVRARQYSPIRHFRTDEKGVPRLGWGYREALQFYYARLDGDREWRRLAKFEAFSDHDELRPIALIPGTNKVYASGPHEGRTALWELDLEDKVAPQLIAHHPRVDVEVPLLADDGHLVGIYYEADKPAVIYTDDRARSVIDGVKKLLPDSFNLIADHSRDEKLYVIRSSSDIDAGSWYLLELGKGEATLQLLGRVHPQIDPAVLGRMQPIKYAAADGTPIPGYLTVPPGQAAKNLPLIVMPHGGPIARDSWEYFFLSQFLVSRGYAVLQMNFRGSDGYGQAWFYAAHQDWGGLTYSDITDGARWAVAQGIADPRRMCIVGWSFGGYAALLGATRNSELYRCAVSIAGISDLPELKWDDRKFTNGAISGIQIGSDGAKLREDSPRRHAQTVKIPLLLVHGTRDVNVEVDQSRMMVSALKRADKAYEYVEIEDADHYLWREAERRRMLEAVEGFLSRNLAVAAQEPAVP